MNAVKGCKYRTVSHFALTVTTNTAPQANMMIILPATTDTDLLEQLSRTYFKRTSVSVSYACSTKTIRYRCNQGQWYHTPLNCYYSIEDPRPVPTKAVQGAVPVVGYHGSPMSPLSG